MAWVQVQFTRNRLFFGVVKISVHPCEPPFRASTTRRVATRVESAAGRKTVFRLPIIQKGRELFRQLVTDIFCQRKVR